MAAPLCFHYREKEGSLFLSFAEAQASPLDDRHTNFNIELKDKIIYNSNTKKSEVNYYDYKKSKC